ncbi:AAA family ATPase [Streptomyces sp. OR43]|uniref:AAA family ATPase n=1 Tax=Streptomyces sp. or43 TaxID=2478957 RepID=UPI0011CEC422|nr:ATP-binding protein [Streptomyces sp. or43]
MVTVRAGFGEGGVSALRATALAGPNGSGKSAFLEALALLTDCRFSNDGLPQGLSPWSDQPTSESGRELLSNPVDLINGVVPSEPCYGPLGHERSDPVSQSGVRLLPGE